MGLFQAVAGLFNKGGKKSAREPMAWDAAYAALQKQMNHLRENEQGLRFALSGMSDGVIAVDGSARVVFLNPPAQELTGYSAERAAGSTFSEVFRVINSITGEPVEDIVQTVLFAKEKVMLPNHTKIVSLNGVYRHISGSAAPIRSAAGEVVGVVLVFSDITERYTLEQHRAADARGAAAMEMADLGSWEYDVRTGITTWSSTYKKLLGVPEEFVPGNNGWQDFIFSDDLNEVVNERERALAQGSRYTNYRIRRQNDGEIRYVRSYTGIERNEAGEVVRMTGVLQDITGEMETNERIRQSEALYRTAFEQSIVGMSHTLPDGRFLRVNKALCDILLYFPDEMLGRSVYDFVHPDDVLLMRNTIGRIVHERFETMEAVRRFLRSDGETVWLSISSSAVYGKGEEPNYILSSIQDITTRHQAQAALLESEQRLKRAQELSHTGNWEIDLKSMKMWASDEAFRIYGYEKEKGNILPLSLAQSAVLAECRPMMDNALARLIREDAVYDVEFSIKRFNDGSRREIHSMAVAERDANGSPLRVVGVLQDITESRRLEEVYGKALSTTSDGFWMCDKEVRVVLVNDAICTMLGYTREELVGMHVRTLEAMLDAEGMRDRRKAVLAAGTERFDTQMRRKDGTVFDAEISLSYISSTESTCAFMRDITERKRREDHIRYLSYHDMLTGLYNRAFFEAECARLDALRLLPVTVVMGDINGLKLTNDVFGHAQGDKLLRAIAKIIGECAGADGIAARIGGDEFCLLLPYAEPEQARDVCERIRIACEGETVRFDDGSEIHPSVAIGHATRWEMERSFNEVFKEAEDVMYKRKLLERKSMHSTLISSIRTTMYEKSHETREHADRLNEMARSLGRRLCLEDAQLSELELLCSLHDLGKIGIPEQILDKPGPLTQGEWFEMRKHPEIGYRIAQSSPELMGVAEGILCHHERWDGNGYPQGLKENNIPLLARILTVVDSFDAMTNDRAYHNAVSREEALAEIEACAGSQFDPQISALFVRMMRDGA